MMNRRVGAVVCSVALTIATLSAGVAPAEARAKEYRNCTALNKDYRHGVGKPGARDRVRGNTQPVTNFKRSTALYKANKKSDRDKDGIACEKR